MPNATATLVNVGPADQVFDECMKSLLIQISQMLCMVFLDAMGLTREREVLEELILNYSNMVYSELPKN